MSNKIETHEQLLLYRENVKTEIQELSSKREYLWRKFKRTQNEDEKKSIRYEIDNITKMLAPKREEVALCDGIEKRANTVQENIKEFEEEKGKEKLKNEF